MVVLQLILLQWSGNTSLVLAVSPEGGKPDTCVVPQYVGLWDFGL